jgi:hypothetical protein
MHHAATLTAGLVTRPDPPRDRAGKPVPEGIAAVLSVVAVLMTYGRHLAEMVEHRAAWRGFATVAQFFGTAALPGMLAHIQRGMMRAMALQHVLLQRAARGRDLVTLARRIRTSRAAPPAAAHAEPDAAEARASRPAEVPWVERPASPPPRRRLPEEQLTLETMPSMAQVEAEVRRRPIGQTIVAICRDLGISPSLCEGAFWHRVFMAIHCYRGNLNAVVLEMNRREKVFDKEDSKHPELGLPEQTRAGIRRVLGFLIGEPPVDPFRALPAPDTLAGVAAPGVPVAAVATGPP